MQVKPQEVSAAKATTPGQRERFEAVYARECSRATHTSCTPAGIANLREGEGYGHRSFLNGWWKGWQAAEAQQAPQWSHAKPSVPGAYWVRGFRIGEPDSRPALVEVTHNEEGELLCNVNEHNTNDETHQWSHVEDMADRFEWFGPLGVKTSMERSTGERELTLALDLAIRSLDQLVPYLGKVPADVGLLNEALMAGRKALQGGAV